MLNAELETLSQERSEELRVISETFQHQALQQGILDKKILEEVLERERTQMIANFIQDASHHFRTPLSIINTNVDIMSRKMGENPYENYFDNIRGQVNTIVELVDTLNYMVQLDSVSLSGVTRIDLNNVARDMFQVKEPAAKQKKIRLVLEESDTGVYISGNLEFVRQAVGRLLDNAIMFTPESGIIKVRVYESREYQIIEVDDNGSGIEESDLEKVFKRFFRSDKAGTTRGFGLGLSIVQRIMDLHEGKADCQSAVGKGSVFRLLFPKGMKDAN
ncbi:MAG: HAMP domain-containing sensor histidine kinase [Anaerolineae bacterium]|nr:HAMP domain-containing sensor histidine kinase [Anaerolineae bacterium]